MTSYYNEFDAAAAAILRQQIANGVIAPGDVDTRSIKDVQPDDLRGYTQCHFFAGGGLWSVAARMAGFPDSRELWTGSCPCQPFSAAGKGAGVDDPRHLWPDFHRLIRARRPSLIMGEQVAGAAGYGWLDGVRTDLANEDYACRGVDIPACAVDAPHQRNRLYWLSVVNTEGERRGEGWRGGRPASAGTDASGDLADGAGLGRQVPAAGRQPAVSWSLGDADQDLDDTGGLGEQQPLGTLRAGRHAAHATNAGRNGSGWADAEWITCHDGKARRTKPGLRLLVDGLPGRVDLWRVGGNAIVPIEAAEVIAAFLEDEADTQRLRLAPSVLTPGNVFD